MGNSNRKCYLYKNKQIFVDENLQVALVSSHTTYCCQSNGLPLSKLRLTHAYYSEHQCLNNPHKPWEWDSFQNPEFLALCLDFVLIRSWKFIRVELLKVSLGSVTTAISSLSWGAPRFATASEGEAHALLMGRLAFFRVKDWNGWRGILLLLKITQSSGWPSRYSGCISQEFIEVLAWNQWKKVSKFLIYCWK